MIGLTVALKGLQKRWESHIFTRNTSTQLNLVLTVLISSERKREHPGKPDCMNRSCSKFAQVKCEFFNGKKLLKS